MRADKFTWTQKELESMIRMSDWTLTLTNGNTTWLVTTPDEFKEWLGGVGMTLDEFRETPYASAKDMPEAIRAFMNGEQ